MNKSIQTIWFGFLKVKNISLMQMVSKCKVVSAFGFSSSHPSLNTACWQHEENWNQTKYWHWKIRIFIDLQSKLEIPSRKSIKELAPGSIFKSDLKKLKWDWNPRRAKQEYFFIAAEKNRAKLLCRPTFRSRFEVLNWKLVFGSKCWICFCKTDKVLCIKKWKQERAYWI